MKKRYVFDLDGTLLTADYSTTDSFFEQALGEKAHNFSTNLGSYLKKYERNNKKYDLDLLSRYLTMQAGFEISTKILNEWMHEVEELFDYKEETVEQVLDTLKRNNNSIALLTNWFGQQQIPRLERAGLIDYFDDLYTGEQVLKPHKEAYITAARGYDPKEVVFIGDNVDFDYIGPKSCGYDAILYDKDEIQHSSIQKVKRLDEILRME